jgi:adenosylmethionine-8-amino-7-oxononanoate aminotransferase
MKNDLIERDLQTIWHPCAQMKDYASFPPLEVTGASGCHIQLASGQQLIDANASWWCKSLGHAHPKIHHALQSQLAQFEHVILANTTNATIVELGETLAQLCAPLNKVMFASDGSCAIEIAMKMSIHARKILGQAQKQHFISLANGYHGETIATLSVSDVGIYRDPYQALMFGCEFIQDIPYVSGEVDPLWTDCDAHWQKIKAQIDPLAASTTALIVEPILQGAGGMKIYSKNLLQRLAQWCKQHDVHLIADEIMTGIGRTGLPLACQHAGITPDFICLAKGLTAGYLPMSVMLTSNEIYQLFYQDYATGNNFLHSHTHSGNALSAKVALASLQTMQEENIYQHVQTITPTLRQHMQAIADSTGKLGNIRSIGAMVAADLMVTDEQPRAGYQVYQQAVKLGALLRPLGNTIYWLPPLIIQPETIKELAAITQEAIETTL